ncbi:MAG: hypothetical protein RJA22_3345 [Verrucomicrobiota bacterium]
MTCPSSPALDPRAARPGAPLRTFLFLAALGSLLLGAGCGKPAAETDPGDIRGTPIAQPVAPPTPKPGAQSAAAQATNAAPAPASTAGVVPANFDVLSGYSIEVSDELLGPITNELAAAAEKTNALIPQPVRDLSQKTVSIKGFMLPLKVEGGLVTELLVMKDQSMCCYGTTPKLNEWVSVKMKKRGVRPLMDQPVTLFGTLHVGEMRENGYLTGIYRLDGDRMEAPEE